MILYMILANTKYKKKLIQQASSNSKNQIHTYIMNFIKIYTKITINYNKMLCKKRFHKYKKANLISKNNCCKINKNEINLLGL